MSEHDRVRELLRARGVRLHDSVIADLATRAEVEQLREVLATIAADTHDYESAEQGRAWRVNLAHEALDA